MSAEKFFAAGIRLQPRPPHPLLDALLVRYTLRNDAELSRMLRLSPPHISKIRHGKLAVSGAVLLLMHEVLEIPVRELKQMMSAA